MLWESLPGDLGIRGVVVRGTDASGRTVVAEALGSQAVPLGLALPVGRTATVGPVTTTATGSIDGVARTGETRTAIHTIRFDGYQTVDVPAGRFVDACRITARITENGPVSESTTWYAPGFGSILKQRAADGSEKLTTGVEIDGRLVAGRLVAVSSQTTAPGTSGGSAGTGPSTDGAKR